MIELEKELAEFAIVLSEKFLDGQIKYVMDELGILSKYESMIMSVKINELLSNLADRESFQLELKYRIDDYGPR